VIHRYSYVQGHAVTDSFLGEGKEDWDEAGNKVDSKYVEKIKQGEKINVMYK
jgi:hypothetical protein